MKKVLFIASSLGIGGIEQSLVDWLNVLAKDKEFQIDLLLFSGQVIENKYEIPSAVSVLSLPKYYSFAFGSFREKLKQKPIACFFSTIRCLIAATPEKIINKETYRMAIIHHYINKMCKIENQYDICIAYSSGAPIYFAVNKTKYRKLITFIHGEISSFSYKRNQEFSSVDTIICVSKKCAESFCKYYPVHKNKVFVINNLFDKTSIVKKSLLPQYEFNRDFFNILSVGRLTPDKNFTSLVDCFHLAMPSFNKKCRLYIIGDGFDKPNVQNQINKHGLNEAIILLGMQDNPYSYMRQCDLYVQPSIAEGYGLTIREAYELKCPILATNVGVVPELIQNGYNGIIADDCSADFSSKLVQLVNDDILRQNIKNNIQENDTNETSVTILKSILQNS